MSAQPHASPRRALVAEKCPELLAAADRYGARDVCLCGSVARGEDHERSDIDFLVLTFDDEDGPDARQRAKALVHAFLELLEPYRVDVRPLPGWPLDPPFAATMRRDAIPLESIA